jgi:hypothetical protein
MPRMRRTRRRSCLDGSSMLNLGEWRGKGLLQMLSSWRLLFFCPAWEMFFSKIPYLSYLAFPKYHVVHNFLYSLFKYPVTCMDAP